MYVGTEEDWDWDYDYENDRYINYIDRIEGYALIPENVKVTLKRGNEIMMSAELATKLDMQDEEFNIEEDSYSVSLTTKIADYTFCLNKAKYNAQADAAIEYYVKKGNKTLLSTAISADLSYWNDELKELSNADISFSIMDKVCIKGTCSDVMDIAYLIEEAEDYDDNENKFKSYISSINDLIDLGIYYDGSNVKQAYVRLEAARYEDWGYEYWDFEPVICFGDGTKYNTFDVFFNENDFRDLIYGFEDMIRDFERLLD